MAIAGETQPEVSRTMPVVDALLDEHRELTDPATTASSQT
jgi:hypothetical protein